MEMDKRKIENVLMNKQLDFTSYCERKLEIVEAMAELVKKDIRLEEEYQLGNQKKRHPMMNYRQACRNFMNHPDEIVKLFYRFLYDKIFQLFKGARMETIRKMRRGETYIREEGLIYGVSGKFLDGHLHICRVGIKESVFYLFYDSKASKAAMYKSKPKGNFRYLYEMKYDRESEKVFYGRIACEPRNEKEARKLLREHFEGHYTPLLPERKTAELEASGEEPKPVSDSDKYNRILEKWDDVLQYVKAEKNVPEVSYITWLKPLKPLMLLDEKLHIVIGLGVLAEYVEKQYGFSIIRGIEELSGFTVQLRFVPENVCSAVL